MVALLFALLGSAVSFANGVAPSSSYYPSKDILLDNASDGSPVISLIQNARRTLDIEIYTMKDLNVIAALKSAMGRGVKLRVIQTPNPVLDTCPVFKPIDDSTDDQCKELRNFVTYVNSHGGQYVPFSFELCGTPGSSCYQHGKMVIADNKKLLLSTGNFDPTNLCDVSQSPDHCNRDFSVVTTDTSVIKTLAKVFANDLKGDTYDLASVLSNSERVTASPDSMKPLVDFIASAKHSIRIQNQYLNDPTLNQALIDAANRGVKVYLMVSSATAFGKLDPVADHAKIEKWTANFTAFDAAGINSRIFTDHMQINGKSGYLHSKVIVVDSKQAWVGSVNGSTKSLTQNREFGIFSSDRKFVSHLDDVLFDDFTNPNSETWKQSLTCAHDACGHGTIIPDENGIDN